MNKRIVLRHASGLRQIQGIMDIPDDTDLPRQLLMERQVCALERAGKRYVVYQEVGPEALAEGQKQDTQ